MAHKSQFDIIVIGAGPVGSMAARVAAKKGAEVLLVDAKSKIGEPAQCAGLLSVRGFEKAKVGKKCILQKIKGAKVYAPSGYHICFKLQKPHAYAIDRIKFDQALFQKAQKTGAETMLEAKATHLSYPYLTLKKDGQKQIIKGKVFIVANGPLSKIREQAGLPAPRRIIYGLQAIIEPQNVKNNIVKIYFSQKKYNNFFAWSIPIGKNKVRVGLGTKKAKAAKTSLEKLLQEKYPNAEILQYQGGLIPLGFSKKTYTEGILICGDAAGQVKPTSGGGICTGLTSAQFAGKIAAEAARVEDTSENFLSQYEKAWKSKIGKELKFGYFIHKIWGLMPNFFFNYGIRVINHPQLIQLIKDYGDIDYPSRVVKKFLKTPRFWIRLVAPF